MNKKVEYGLIKTFSPYSEIIDCDGFKCGRPINFMEHCYIDNKTTEVFCNNCGPCIRYERKKLAQREAMGLSNRKINGE